MGRGGRGASRIARAIQREGWVLGLEPSDPWFWDMDAESCVHLALWIWEDLSPAERRVAKVLPLDELASFALAGRDFGMAPELALHRKAARAVAFCSIAGAAVELSLSAPKIAAAMALASAAHGLLAHWLPHWHWAAAGALTGLCALKLRSELRGPAQGDPKWMRAKKIWPELFEDGGDEARARSMASYWALPAELKALAPEPKSPWVKARVCQQELEESVAPAPSKPRSSRRL